MVLGAFPYFRIASDEPFERGRQLGSAAGRHISESVSVYKETFGYYTKLPWPDVRKLAGEFREAIVAYDPAIMREIEGIADGTGLPVEDILAINARTEIMFGMGVKPPSECTSFYVGPGASAEGDVFIGQNWDWRPRAIDTTLLIEIEQPPRPSLTMLAEAGLVGKLGFNSSGIGVAVNALISTLDHGARDVPVHIVLRGILNAHTLDEAVSAVTRAKRAASANYLVGSADGFAVNIETGPGGAETVIITHPTNDLLCHANHFQCDGQFDDVGVSEWPDSLGRAQTFTDGLEDRRGSLAVDGISELLRDHAGFPHSICRHEDEEQPDIERSTSVASWIVNLSELNANICKGTPCAGEYETFLPSFASRKISKR